MKKALGYTVVGLLVLGLVAGVAYILLNPTGAQAERNGTTSGQGQGQGSNGTGQGRGKAGGVESFDQVTNESGQKEELSAEEIEALMQYGNLERRNAWIEMQNDPHFISTRLFCICIT